MSEPPRVPLPAVAQAILWIRRPIELMRWCERRYGPVFRIRLPDLGDIVLYTEPEAIKEIFTGDPELMLAGEGNAPLKPVLGPHSLLMLDRGEHLRHRRLMLPPFHGERMRAYAEVMGAIAQDTMSRWPDDRAMSVHPSMQEITLEIILRTVFGIDERARLDELRALLVELLDITTNALSPFFFIPSLQRDFGPWRPWTHFQDLLGRIDELIHRQIARQRERKGEQRDDVLSLLLGAVDEKGSSMSDAELRDELMTLLLAGHETTATALSWAFEQILSHAGVHHRLKEELDEVVGDSALGAEHLGRLTYLDATVREVLRLRPVIPVVVRKLTADTQIGGYTVPRGARVAPCIYLAGRRAAAFPEPDAFRPQRFVDKKTDPYAWLPFGGGVRRCLGMAFALYEMKVILAVALSSFDMSLAEPVPIRMARRGITFAPAGGTKVRATRRRRRAAA